MTILVLMLLPVQAAAQTTMNPRTAEFWPSPDHSTTVGGVPVVQSYLIEFYLLGAPAPFQSASLGKPAPDSDGL